MNVKPYFSRKNLIAVAISGIYSFILLFVGMCLDAGSAFMNKNNPIALLAKGLGFEQIVAGVTGFITLALVAIYIVLFTVMFIYERNFALRNNMKPTSWKIILTQIGTFVLCVLLSLGLGFLIQIPIKDASIPNTWTYVWQSFVLALILFIVLSLFVVAILMLIINFRNVDKPYRFFDKKNMPEFEEEEESQDADVIASFDVKGQVNPPLNTASTDERGVTTTKVEIEELSDREKVFPSLSTIDVKYEGFAIDKVETDDLSLEEICVKFRNYLASKEHLYFDIDTIRVFVSGFAASHFMILEGLSGTGKSSLPRYFAKFVSGKALFVPVQATWRDKTNLLGYFNDFSKTYTETEFLIGLYEANYNPDQINIFVLDEMNISRVEYYFADLLSTLEYPTDEWKLKIMQLPFGFVPPAQLNDGYVSINENSYFIGTANKDDSTFSITDKVYDRAITIDFDNRNDPFEVKEDQGPIKLSVSKLKELFELAKANKANIMTKEDFAKFNKITEYIYEEFDLTFGNRILNQIEVLVPTFIACGGKKEDVLDFLLTRKVITKLDGRFEEYVKPALINLRKLIEKTYGAGVFKKSEKAINSLIRKL
ncbi:MAG: hypothetical protein PUA56_06070 [Bacillales bacterium]|nr:hypothetical protein [Bacillales bacterium]